MGSNLLGCPVFFPMYSSRVYGRRHVPRAEESCLLSKGHSRFMIQTPFGDAIPEPYAHIEILQNTLSGNAIRPVSTAFLILVVGMFTWGSTLFPDGQPTANGPHSHQCYEHTLCCLDVGHAHDNGDSSPDLCSDRSGQLRNRAHRNLEIMVTTKSGKIPHYKHGATHC